VSQSDAPKEEETGDEPVNTEEEPAAPLGTQAGGSTTTRNKVVLFSTAAVAVLVVVGVVVYLLTRDDATSEAGGPDVPSITDAKSPSRRMPAPPPSGSTATITAPSSTAPPAATGEAGAAQSVAEQVATAITNADVTTLVQLSCDPSSVGSEDSFPTDAKVEVIGEPQVDGETATINVRVTITGAEPAEVPMPLTKKDGRWCIP
jgi:hypothetical protein